MLVLEMKPDERIVIRHLQTDEELVILNDVGSKDAQDRRTLSFEGPKNFNIRREKIDITKEGDS